MGSFFKNIGVEIHEVTSEREFYDVDEFHDLSTVETYYINKPCHFVFKRSDMHFGDDITNEMVDIIFNGDNIIDTYFIPRRGYTPGKCDNCPFTTISGRCLVRCFNTRAAINSCDHNTYFEKI